ncbi:8903_t:CDS:2, partial [Ambispora leptoticha]
DDDNDSNNNDSNNDDDNSNNDDDEIGTTSEEENSQEENSNDNSSSEEIGYQDDYQEDYQENSQEDFDQLLEQFDIATTMLSKAKYLIIAECRIIFLGLKANLTENRTYFKMWLMRYTQEIFVPIQTCLPLIYTATSSNETQNLQGYQYFTSRLTQSIHRRIASNNSNDEIERYWLTQ